VGRLCTQVGVATQPTNLDCSCFHIDRLILVLQRSAFLFIRWGFTNRTKIGSVLLHRSPLELRWPPSTAWLIVLTTNHDWKPSIAVKYYIRLYLAPHPVLVSFVYTAPPYTSETLQIGFHGLCNPENHQKTIKNPETWCPGDSCPFSQKPRDLPLF